MPLGHPQALRAHPSNMQMCYALAAIQTSAKWWEHTELKPPARCCALLRARILFSAKEHISIQPQPAIPSSCSSERLPVTNFQRGSKRRWTWNLTCHVMMAIVTGHTLVCTYLPDGQLLKFVQGVTPRKRDHLELVLNERIQCYSQWQCKLFGYNVLYAGFQSRGLHDPFRFEVL